VKQGILSRIQKYAPFASKRITNLIALIKMLPQFVGKSVPPVFMAGVVVKTIGTNTKCSTLLKFARPM
jgi:hypothetical protein